MLENELSQAVEKLKDEETKISTSGVELVRSLPEKDRLRIFKAMMTERKNSSTYSMWKDIVRGWFTLRAVAILLTAIIAVGLLGLKGGWEFIKELFRGLSFLY